MAASRFYYRTYIDCVVENSLLLSGYGIGFWCTRSLVRILPGPYISAIHLFICLFVTDFVCKVIKTTFQEYYFPEDIGVPIGGVDEPGVYVLAIHYDNSDYTPGKPLALVFAIEEKWPLYFCQFLQLSYYLPFA